MMLAVAAFTVVGAAFFVVAFFQRLYNVGETVCPAIVEFTRKSFRTFATSRRINNIAAITAETIVAHVFAGRWNRVFPKESPVSNLNSSTGTFNRCATSSNNDVRTSGKRSKRNARISFIGAPAWNRSTASRNICSIIGFINYVPRFRPNRRPVLRLRFRLRLPFPRLANNGRRLFYRIRIVVRPTNRRIPTF